MRRLVAAAVCLGLVALTAAVAPAAAGAPAIEISVTPRELVFPFMAVVHVRLTGSYDPSQPVMVLAANAPYRTYVTVAEFTPSGHETANVSLPVLTTGRWRYRDRNFRVYATDGATRSRTLLVYVRPLIAFSAESWPYVPRPYVRDGCEAEVHLMRHYPRTRVYFYNRPAGTNVYQLFAVRPLRPAGAAGAGSEYLVADARLYASSGGTMLACVKRRIVADMGPPFVNRRCGRPSLAEGGGRFPSSGDAFRSRAYALGDGGT